MVIIITEALVQTLVKYIFNSYLNEVDKVEINGAPSWYMKPIDNNLCVFSYKSGEFNILDDIKHNSKIKLTKKINNLIEISIYDNLKHIKNEQERTIIDLWKIDSKLPIFIDKNINYSRLTYEEEINSAFIRTCIPTQTIINYQKSRLNEIKREVVKVKMDSALEELDFELENIDKER
jgi:hypothetical protein